MRLVGALLLLATGGTASAQPPEPSTDLDLQLFQPTYSVGSTFTIDRPTVPRHLTFSVGLGVNFATDLLTRDDGFDVVPWRAQFDLLAALGLFEFLEIGAAFPVSVLDVAEVRANGTIEDDSAVTFAPGDTRLGLKVPLLRGDFGLALRGEIVLPSGDGHALAGTDYWSGMPAVVLAIQPGRFLLAADLGLRFRRRAQLGSFRYDDELQVKVGAGYAFSDAFSLLLETHIRVGIHGAHVVQNPMEIDGGIRWTSESGVSLEAGAGTGMTQGYGAPIIRGFVIFRYATEREACPAGPEDFDGYEDGDFCADADNDADGVDDADEECPNDPEDRDEFLDEDGCPDTDNDADAVVDATDECPLESEDRDGYGDEDGCPEVDNDEDGLADGVDQCPMEPEDRDDFDDEDGCPEPGPEAAQITVTDTDVIRSVSQPLLDQVAEVINDLPGERGIRVEGYTDAEGNEQYNLDLSYRRARAVVEYLAGRGVQRARLTYVGYGEARPVAPNDDPDGRALNRRVEFTILEPGERGQEAPPPPRPRRPTAPP